jgi:hypothetical protein
MFIVFAHIASAIPKAVSASGYSAIERRKIMIARASENVVSCRQIDPEKAQPGLFRARTVLAGAVIVPGPLNASSYSLITSCA